MELGHFDKHFLKKSTKKSATAEDFGIDSIRAFFPKSAFFFIFQRRVGETFPFLLLYVWYERLLLRNNGVLLLITKQHTYATVKVKVWLLTIFLVFATAELCPDILFFQLFCIFKQSWQQCKNKNLQKYF